jgi:hypothetical protein
MAAGTSRARRCHPPQGVQHIGLTVPDMAQATRFRDAWIAAQGVTKTCNLKKFSSNCRFVATIDA